MSGFRGFYCQWFYDFHTKIFKTHLIALHLTQPMISRYTTSHLNSESGHLNKNRYSTADPSNDRTSPPIAKVGVLLRSDTQNLTL